MKCEYCPALLKEGYEYPEYYCGLGEEEIEFLDGSLGCNRKSIKKIKKDLKAEYDKWEPEIVKQMGEQAEFYEQNKLPTD